MSRIASSGFTRQREPRVRDPGYLSWLHHDLPCIACLIGRTAPDPSSNPIEAAHQKLAIASHGWREGGGGVRVDDARCAPLCAWHHRLAPDACDNGQRRFWDRLGLGDGVADLCADLYAAFQAGEPGRTIILRYARSA